MGLSCTREREKRKLVLEEEQREVLRGIRNVCVDQSGLNPRDIDYIIEKLIEASRCFIQEINDLRGESEAIREIVNRLKAALANAPIPRIANNVLDSCQNLLGPQDCAEVVEFAGKLVDSIQSEQSLLPQ